MQYNKKEQTNLLKITQYLTEKLNTKTLDDVKLLLLEELQPKRETFYEVDLESESDENEKVS
jgi:hypothetical protein